MKKSVAGAGTELAERGNRRTVSSTFACVCDFFPVVVVGFVVPCGHLGVLRFLLGSTVSRTGLELLKCMVARSVWMIMFTRLY